MLFFSRRARMLLPIFPRPMRPMCMIVLRVLWLANEFLPQQKVGLQKVLVVVRAGLVLRGLTCDQHRTGLVGVVGLGEGNAHEFRMHRSETIEQELWFQ